MRLQLALLPKQGRYNGKEAGILTSKSGLKFLVSFARDLAILEWCLFVVVASLEVLGRCCCFRLGFTTLML